MTSRRMLLHAAEYHGVAALPIPAAPRMPVRIAPGVLRLTSTTIAQHLSLRFHNASIGAGFAWSS